MRAATATARVPARPVRVGAALVVVMALAAWSTGPAAPPPDPRTYRPPVEAPVTDPFRPPAQPWLAGNRGLEYATAPGTPVGAMGPGVVVFAGPVAGALYVTVLHPDGLRSSYSYLAAIRVQVGQRVLGGDVVGISGPVLHLGVRAGDTYLDPASLFGTRVQGGTVHLVPLGGVGERAGPGPRPRPAAAGAGSPRAGASARFPQVGGGATAGRLGPAAATALSAALQSGPGALGP